MTIAMGVTLCTDYGFTVSLLHVQPLLYICNNKRRIV